MPEIIKLKYCLINTEIWLPGHVSLVSVAFDEAVCDDWSILQRKQFTSWNPGSKRNKRRKSQHLCQGVNIPTFASRRCFSKLTIFCGLNVLEINLYSYVTSWKQVKTSHKFISFGGNIQGPNNIIVRVLNFSNIFIIYIIYIIFIIYVYIFLVAN